MSGLQTTCKRWQECIHEAGHAAALCELFGLHPSEIDVSVPRIALPNEEFGEPCDAADAVRFAAYYEAGRAAEWHGVRSGLLPAGADLDRGYGRLDQHASDAARVQALVDRHGFDPGLARARASSCIACRWPDIVQLARELEAQIFLERDCIAKLMPIRLGPSDA
jgi:hypothetical protein